MSNNLDRALGTKHYSNTTTPASKLVQENTIKVLNKHRSGIRLTTVLLVIGALIAGIVLYETGKSCVQSNACVIKD